MKIKRYYCTAKLYFSARRLQKLADNCDDPTKKAMCYQMFALAKMAYELAAPDWAPTIKHSMSA